MTTTRPTARATSPSPGALTAASAVLRTEARLFGRELGFLFWIVLSPVTLLCILGAIPSFREPDPALGDLALVDLYVPVAIIMSMIMAAIMAMPSVIWAYRESGVLRRLRTTPVQPQMLLVTQVVLHAAAVVVASALVLGVGRLLGTPLPTSWAGYGVAYVLVLLASFSLGAVITAVAPNARTGTILGTVLFFVSMFTAGVYYPVQAMGEGLRQVVELTPLGAATEAMTDAMVASVPDPRHLLVVGAWALVLSLISVRMFRWE